MQTNNYQIEIITRNHIIVHKLSILDRNSWSDTCANYLYLKGILDITVCKKPLKKQLYMPLKITSLDLPDPSKYPYQF